MGQPQKIRDIMTSGVIAIKQDENVMRAADTMAEHNISCVIVTPSDTDKTPIGIITERDLVRRVLIEGKDPKKTKIKSVMTTSLVTITEEASLEEGMRIIQNMKIRRLPVIGKDGVAGLVTETDIVRHSYDIHSFNKRLIFHQNLQSYIIVAIALLVAVVLFVKFVLLA